MHILGVLQVSLADTIALMRAAASSLFLLSTFQNDPKNYNEYCSDVKEIYFKSLID